MRSAPARPLRLAAAIVAAGRLASPARAQDVESTSTQMENQVEIVAQALETEKNATTSKAKDRDLLAFPLPISSPQLGTGLILAGVAFYNPNAAPSPWITGAAAMKTSNGNWMVGGMHSMSLGGDRLRLSATGGSGKLISNYYGIGPEAGDRDVKVEIREKVTSLQLQGQVRVAPRFYLGARFLYQSVDARQDDPEAIPYADLGLPANEADSQLVRVGPALSYDSRDNPLNPHAGLYASANLLMGTSLLGGDFHASRLNALVSAYLPHGAGRTFALHAGLCAASASSPYYALCQFGQNADLRGYVTGRYRDRASWALQGEVRQHLFGRLGATAFAGIGGIAPSLGRLGDTRWLPAAGAGLRYRPLRSTDINLRLDVAVGRDSSALYVGMAEAF